MKKLILMSALLCIFSLQSMHDTTLKEKEKEITNINNENVEYSGNAGQTPDENQTPENPAAIAEILIKKLIKNYLAREAFIKDLIYERNTLPYEVNKNIKELLQYLIDQGLNINAVDDEGNNLLHLAAKHQDIDLFNWLLSMNADSLRKNNNGQDPYQLFYNPPKPKYAQSFEQNQRRGYYY